MPNSTEIIKRDVGERVDIICNLDPTTVKDLGDGVFEAVVTTKETDRSGENIVTSGVDTTTWEKTGMPVLYGHDYSGLPIGKGLDWKSTRNKMTSRFQLAIQEYPFAATVAAMIKGGYLNSVSIGGIVKKWSDDYLTIQQMEMVEFSVVPIPANASALITSRALEEVTGKSVTEIKGEFDDFNRKVIFDKVKGMGENEVTDAIRVLSTLIARLEDTASAQSPDEKQVRRTHLVLADARAVAAQSRAVIKTVKLSIR